jgi:TRAP-type C4-dicarboxylate transport system permease small subunit
MQSKMIKVLRPLHWLEDMTLVSLVLLLVGLSIVQILLRNISDSGLVWAENALRILVLWVAMFGAMRASRDGEHIAIDILRRYFSGRLQLFTSWIALLASGNICIVAAYYSWQFVLLEKADGMIAFLSVPVWLCEAIIPFALACMAARFIFQSVTLVVNGE